MLSIGWVMFWKALILAGWAELKDYRETQKERGVDPSLLAAFQREWDRRRAKQPLTLPDLRARPLDNVGPVD